MAKSIGIPIGIPRIGNLGWVNYVIWGREFDEKSIGILIGIPRIGNLGGGDAFGNSFLSG